jgi:TPP-dependent pyruvate/acetoin dehydrogenase alpha subunit
MTMHNKTNLYQKMLLIRRFDEKVLNTFSSGVFHGTTHTYLGQEANAVGIITNLEADDLVFSNHRCHGHFLAYGGSPHALFAELMGRSTGVVAGRGGSQHIHWKNFYSSGVQGSLVPTAVGAALAEKLQGHANIAVSFIGDGTLGQGVLYESLNMASLWSAPVLFVVENNRIAQTTPIELSIAGDILSRFEAFGIKSHQIKSADVEEISSTSKKMISEVRQSKKPQALIIHTHRFGPHSKGDDTRTPEQIEQIKNTHDPIKILVEKLNSADIESIAAETEALINSAFEQAKSDPIRENA